tara:strand:+ start:4241 stop:5614 length:1374 start_codon:yes stop_codon:yes gene_type:complete
MQSKISFLHLKSYSAWEYILRLSAIIAFSFFCFFSLNFDSTPLSGFISSSIAFLIITIVSAIVLLRDKEWVWFFALAYLIHLGIGLLHYLIFLDVNYFDTSGLVLPLPPDFTIPLDAVNEIIASKKINGLFYYENYYLSHIEIWNLISYPFYFFGGYVLNIAPLNSFMSVFTSINVFLISKFYLKYKSTELKKILILTAYFPLTLISSLFFRDVVGLGLISLGLVIVCLSKEKMYYYLMLAIAFYLFYMQRTIYPLVLLLAVIFDFLNTKKTGQSLGRRIISFIVFVSIFGIMLRLSYMLGLADGNNSRYIDGAATVNYLFFPVKLVMGLVGPFPWTQYFTTERMVYSYQFADYLQGALNITIVFLMIKFKSSFFKKSQINLLNLTGLFLMMSGLATTFMHSAYVSIGILFLVPWIVNSSSWGKLKRYYLGTFIFMLVFSIIIMVFFGSLGTSKLWK